MGIVRLCKTQYVRLVVDQTFTNFDRVKTYFFSHAGQDDEEGHKNGYEDDTKCDGGHIASDGRSVGAVVKRRPTVVTKCIKPAFHFLSFCQLFFFSFVWCYFWVVHLLHYIYVNRLLTAPVNRLTRNAKRLNNLEFISFNFFFFFF